MSECDLCVAGQYQELTGSRNCSESPAGYTANDERTAIVKCDAGTFADVPGLPKCKDCEPGTTQHLQGAHGCTACAKGHSSAVTGDTDIHCDPCRAGRFADVIKLANCKLCFPGSFQELMGAHNCSLSHAGYFPSADRTSQIPCEKGYFADVRGLEHCKACDEGQFADTVGRHKCSLCPGGHAAPNKAAVLCDACTPGRWSNSTGSKECTLCAPGKTTDHFHAYKCDKCAPGHAQPNEGGATEHCPVCEIGFYADEYGMANCVSCGISGYTTSTGSTECQPCLTFDAVFGLSNPDQCMITWLVLFWIIVSIACCCGLVCWCKNGCPCKFWCQKYIEKKGGKKEGFSSLHSVATMSDGAQSFGSPSPQRSSGGGYNPPISEVGSPAGGNKAGVSPQRGVELMRSESTTHVANPLEPVAPQAATPGLAVPGEAKA
jgi:hypothetical protein